MIIKIKKKVNIEHSESWAKAMNVMAMVQDSWYSSI